MHGNCQSCVALAFARVLSVLVRGPRLQVRAPLPRVVTVRRSGAAGLIFSNVWQLQLRVWQARARRYERYHQACCYQSW